MSINPNAGTQMFYTRPSDGGTYCFSPVPLIAESKEFLTTADGETRLGVIHEVTFNGTLVASRPTLSGVSPDASCLEILDRKSDQLCSALEDRGDLLIVDASGYPVLAVKPRVVSLTFDESQMVQRRDYSLVFSFEDEFDGGFVREFNENWSFEQQENDTTSVTHTVSAIGLTDADGGTTALANARAFVLTKINASGLPDKTQSSVIKTPFVSALVDIDNLQSLNHVFTEQVGITEGSYEVTETWVLSSGLFLDDRTVEITTDLDEQGVQRDTVTINGTVQGYGNTTFDKLQNAIDGFNNFVSPQIGFSATSGISTKTRTENRVAGTVSYALSRIPDNPDQQLDSRSISRSFERQDDGSVVQTVTTNATIRPGSASGIDSAIAFCFENNFPIDSAEPIFDASLSGNLVSVSTSRDDIQKSFSLTRSFQDQTTVLFREEFTVERAENVDTSVTTITVAGSVFGLGEESTTKSQDRFLTASGAFFGAGGIESVIRDRALTILPTGSCVSDDAVNSTLSYNPFAGTINYSESFDSRFKTSNASVLSEQIEVSFSLKGDVIAIIAIPGKSDGPILQDQETKTGLEKSLSISYTMKRTPNQCKNSVIPNNSLLQDALNESNILVDNTPSDDDRGEKPESSKVFKTQDQYTWNRQTLVFTRSVTWQFL